MGFFSSALHSWKPDAHSWLSPQERSLASYSSQLSCLGGCMILVKFLLPTSLYPKLYFFLFLLLFCSNRMLEWLLWKTWTSTRLFCVWVLPTSVFSSRSQTGAKRGWSQFIGSCRWHSSCRGLSAYYLMHRTLGTWCWIQLPQRHLRSQMDAEF